MFSDPLRGRNPYAVARLVRSRNAPCPKCGGKASLTASVKDDEVLGVCSCPSCGDSPVTVTVAEDGDILFGYGGEDYLPTFEEKEAASADPSDVRNSAILNSKAARLCARAGRPSKAVSLLKSNADSFRAHIGEDGWEDAPTECIKAVIEAAEMLTEQGDPSEAISYMDGFRGISDSLGSSVGVDFTITSAVAHLHAGDPKDSVRELRSLLEGGISQDMLSSDPYVRIRVNEALGTILVSKPDPRAAMKCYDSAIREVSKMKADDTSLRTLCRLSGEYAEAAVNAQMEKKATEAIKNMVRTCKASAGTFPGAYAESLLQRARYLNSVDAVDPGLRDSMDEAISILREPDGSGMYDRLLPLAYYYRSASSGKKDALDIEDLALAYEILRDGLVSGDLPDGVMQAVAETYVQYLDLFNRERSKTVRSELAGLGFVFPPPPELKGQEGPEKD